MNEDEEEEEEEENEEEGQEEKGKKEFGMNLYEQFRARFTISLLGATVNK